MKARSGTANYGGRVSPYRAVRQTGAYRKTFRVAHSTSVDNPNRYGAGAESEKNRSIATAAMIRGEEKSVPDMVF